MTILKWDHMVVSNVSDPALKGQRFRVGNGEYRFQ